MGADMIGYFMTFPDDAKLVRSALKKHALAVMKDLGEVADIEVIRTGEFSPDRIKKDKIEAFLKKHPGWAQEVENREMAPADILEMVQKDLDVAASFNPKELGYRDIALTSMKINGKVVDTIFAGGMSWGDEPDGAGYEMMKSMWNSGAGDVLWKLVHWDAR